MTINSARLTNNIILKWMTNIFARYALKISTNIIEMNMGIFILLGIYLHRCGYKEIFTKLYLHLGVYNSELFSVQMHIMDAIK